MAEDFYQVAEIIARKIENFTWFYKVRWEGFSRTQSTWEPFENLKNVNFMLKDYNRDNPFTASEESQLSMKYKNQRNTLFYKSDTAMKQKKTKSSHDSEALEDVKTGGDIEISEEKLLDKGLNRSRSSKQSKGKHEKGEANNSNTEEIKIQVNDTKKDNEKNKDIEWSKDNSPKESKKQRKVIRISKGNKQSEEEEENNDDNNNNTNNDNVENCIAPIPQEGSSNEQEKKEHEANNSPKQLSPLKNEIKKVLRIKLNEGVKIWEILSIKKVDEVFYAIVSFIDVNYYSGSVEHIGNVPTYDLREKYSDWLIEFYEKKMEFLD